MPSSGPVAWVVCPRKLRGVGSSYIKSLFLRGGWLIGVFGPLSSALAVRYLPSKCPFQPPLATSLFQVRAASFSPAAAPLKRPE